MLVKNLVIWTKTVKERDNYTCQNCGTTKGRICAHHIIPKEKEFKPSDLDTDNGKTLCQKCHNLDLNRNKKISESLKGLMVGEKNGMYGVSRFGEDNPFYGKKHSEETKKIMSENHSNFSGKSNPFYGKHHSKESIEMMKLTKATNRLKNKYQYFLGGI